MVDYEIHVVFLYIRVMLKHLSRLGTLVKSQLSKMETPPPRSIEDIHKTIIPRIRTRMPWDRIVTRCGRTQAAESEHIYHLRQAIIDEEAQSPSIPGRSSRGIFVVLSIRALTISLITKVRR